MQRSFKRELGSLPPLFEFTNEAAVRYHLDKDVVHAMDLAVEELFTNMVKYGGGGADVSVGVEVREGGLVIEMVHPGATPFDVTASGAVDVTRALDQRAPGGLGLHLVRRVMDDVVYTHEKGAARITLRKRLGGG
jgi:anti-sigma regulatory factor (Ser/Thr protein kinase)